MIEKTLIIQNERGMHVRPCAAFASLANRFNCDIFVLHHGDRFRGKTSMNLLSAWIQEGDEITIVCDGNDESEAMAALLALIASDFDDDSVRTLPKNA